MKIITLLIMLFGFLGLFSCKESNENKSILYSHKNCDDSLYNLNTSVMSDSAYSLHIKTYSLLDTSMTKLYNVPCVIDQKVIFKLNDSVINIKHTPISERKTDSNKQCYFLRYVITGIAIDSIDAQKVYMLYLFAANGEAEYNFYYNQKGNLLFYQRCDKVTCSIKCYNFDEKTAMSYTKDNTRILNIIPVNGVCN